jgi:hypothetical protein
VIWETSKSNKQRFKPLSVKDSLAIEEAFVRYNMALAVRKPVNSRITVDSKIEVNIYIYTCSMKIMHFLSHVAVLVSPSCTKDYQTCY